MNFKENNRGQREGAKADIILAAVATIGGLLVGILYFVVWTNKLPLATIEHHAEDSTRPEQQTQKQSTDTVEKVYALKPRMGRIVKYRWCGKTVYANATDGHHAEQQAQKQKERHRLAGYAYAGRIIKYRCDGRTVYANATDSAYR
jgi:hypothetical protein